MIVKLVRPWLSHDARPRGASISTIVLHHDAGSSAAGTIRYLRRVPASYHYIVERDGTIYKCVPTSGRAWHAGVSHGPQGPGVNSYSIGVCLSNLGGLNGRFEPYPKAQTDAARALIAQLAKVIPTIRYITTHRLITSRKVDPARFDFLEFARTTSLQPWRHAPLKREWNG